MATVFGPTAGGNIAYGTSSGTVIAYGTRSSSAPDNPGNGEGCYADIRGDISYYLDQGDTDAILKMMTPENYATVKRSAPNIIGDEPFYNPMYLTPLESNRVALLGSIDSANTVEDVLTLFNGFNVATAGYYEAYDELLTEYDGNPLAQKQVEDEIEAIDQITQVKEDVQC